MGKFSIALAFPVLLLGQSSSGTIPPLTVHEKFEYRVLSVFGPTKLLTLGVYAGYSQLTNTPSEWGQGAEGYGKRYASQFGGTIARQSLAFGLEAALHHDPRYFPSGERAFKRRLGSVIRQTFIARKDSGGTQFAYARISSAFGAVWIQNSWQPDSTRTAGNAMTTFGITIAGDAGYNFLQEFIPFLRPKELRNR